MKSKRIADVGALVWCSSFIWNIKWWSPCNTGIQCWHPPYISRVDLAPQNREVLICCTIKNEFHNNAPWSSVCVARSQFEPRNNERRILLTMPFHTEVSSHKNQAQKLLLSSFDLWKTKTNIGESWRGALRGQLNYICYGKVWRIWISPLMKRMKS